MMRAPSRVIVACLASALALGTARAASPDAGAPTPAPAETATRPMGPLGADVPRGAVDRFLAAGAANDYERAAEFLDLRKVPRPARPHRGPLLARQLEAVLERTVDLAPALLSADPEGERDDGLAPDRELLAVVETEAGPVELLLERGTVAGATVWRVASDTVTRIPALYEELGYGPFADRLPAPLVTVRLLGMRLWQWIGLLGLVGIAAGLAWLATRLLGGLAERLVVRAGLDGRLVSHALGPVRLLLVVAVAAAGIPFLSLALVPRRVLAGLGKALVVVAFTWLLLRTIDVLAKRAQRRFVQRRQLAAVSMVPLGRRALKLVVAAFALVAALQSFGFNVTGIAAGLGIGGLAVALAAQKTVENLFGGVTLIADQPVRVGDLCRFGDTQGVVEDIGLRSTRVRTLDRTVVTVPNAAFSAMPLENLSRRDRMAVRATLQLKPETPPARVREMLDHLRGVLAAQAKVEPSSARATFVRLGPQIEIELFAYLLTTEHEEYLRERERIFLAALEVVEGAAAALR